MSELSMREFDPKIISRGMVYGKELDEYMWAEREKWAIRSFFAGALCASIAWMIVLGV